MSARLRVQVSPMLYRDAPWTMLDCITRDMAQWHRREDVAVTMRWAHNDALVSRLRSLIASEFMMRETHDVLVMIDADTVWGDGDVLRIAAVANDCGGIVGGMVPKRGPGLGIASFPIEQRKLVPGDAEAVDATYVGSAFCAFSRAALKRVIEFHSMRLCAFGTGDFWPLFMPFTIESRSRPGFLEYMSEDYAICVRAALADVPVKLDQKPVLQHFGDKAWTFAEAMDGAPDPGGIDPLGILDLRKQLASERAK